MSARYVRAKPASDMASTVPEKAGMVAHIPPVTSWEPPTTSDRDLVRAGLIRNGAYDLADILGLDTVTAVGSLALSCPTCGAAAGHPCTTTAVRSRLVEGYHRARRETA